MDLRQLTYFRAVADAGSFTAAARSLFVAQSGLSVAVAALEDELGTELLTRRARGVALTDAGRLLLSHAREILAAVDDTRTAIEELAGGLRGAVRIGVMHQLVPDAVVEALARLRRERPGVEISLRTDPAGSRGLLDAVRSGDLDVALAACTPSLANDLLVTTVREDALATVVPDGHHLADRRRVRLVDLCGEPFVDVPDGWGSRVAADAAFERAGLRRHVEMEVGDVVTVTQLVAAGLGIALLAPSSAPPRRGTQTVAVHPRIPFSVGLILPGDRASTAAATAVHGELLARLRPQSTSATTVRR